MTIATAKAALRGQLLTITSPQTPKKVYASAKEATSLGEFPCGLIYETPGATHTWSTEAMGGGMGVAKHDYTLTILWFVGARATPLGELIDRNDPWPEALFRCLVADVTLGGAVLQIGAGNSPALFTYQVGPLAWGDQEFYGTKVLLPVVEKPYNVEMGP